MGREASKMDTLDTDELKCFYYQTNTRLTVRKYPDLNGSVCETVLAYLSPQKESWLETDGAVRCKVVCSAAILKLTYAVRVEKMEVPRLLGARFSPRKKGPGRKIRETRNPKDWL